MVAETAEIALFRSVDELAFVEGHEVEVLDALLIVLPHSPGEGILTNDLSDVLENEVIWFEVRVSPQAIALFLCLEDGDSGVLLVLEALVLALGSALAIVDTLDFRGTVDAIRVLTASMVGFCSSICWKLDIRELLSEVEDSPYSSSHSH